MSKTVLTNKLISKLIRFDTSNPNRSNKDIIDFIERYLNKYNIPCNRIHNRTTNENLFATIGPKDQAGIIFSGHLDVVPIQKRFWKRSSFKARIKDKKLYGRGSCDMKGFIGCVLSSIPDLTDMKLKKPIHIALTCDEETHCQGIEDILDFISQQKPLPQCAIIGEPTNMEVINTHKGLYTFEVSIQDRFSHTNDLDFDVSLMSISTKLLNFIRHLGEKYQNPRNPNHITTFNFGVINHDISSNIVENKCTFEWEYRPPNDAIKQEIFHAVQNYMNEIISRYSNIKIKMTPILSIPPLIPENQSNIFETLLGKEAIVPRDTSLITEAGFYQQKGIPSIIIGPGSTSQAHQLDEYISLAQLEKCQTFLEFIFRFVTI